jgi:hypothetical protein
MGAAMTYVVVKDKPDSALMESLKISELGDGDYIHDLYGSDDITCCLFESGWHVITNYGNPDDLIAPAILKRLSAGTKLVACEVEEHVMYSAAEGWGNGVQIWKVVHDSQEAENHLVTSGVMPKGYDALADYLKQRQSEPMACDYLFSVAPELVNNIAGFEYLGNHLFPKFEIEF